MQPALNQFSEENDILKFTLHGVNVCFANAIRRTILSDIPIVVIHTDSHETNQCTIKQNTGRLHNEIIKQRLSCIPIHTTLLRDTDKEKALPGNYSLVLDITNDTDNTIFVTSGETKHTGYIIRLFKWIYTVRRGYSYCSKIFKKMNLHFSKTLWNFQFRIG